MLARVGGDDADAIFARSVAARILRRLATEVITELEHLFGRIAARRTPRPRS